MLGMFYVNGPNPLGPNPWKKWVDHVTKQKDCLGLTKATLVYNQNGGTASATSGFVLTPREVKKIKLIFPDPADNNNTMPEADRFSIKDKTYMIKTVSANQAVAFNGPRYVIVTRSKTMMLVTMCECRTKYSDAAIWLSKICARLVEKDF